MGSPQPPQMGTARWPHSGHPYLELEPQTFRQGRGWLKHQEGSQGLSSALVLLGKTTGLPPVAHIPLPEWAWRTQLSAHVGLREVGCRPASSGSDGAPHLYFSALSACLDPPLWGPVLRWTQAFTKVDAHLPQAVLGDSANGGGPSCLLQPQSLHDSLWLNPSRQPEC